MTAGAVTTRACRELAPDAHAAGATAAYVRQARRLRHQHRQRPDRLHPALRALADQHDARAMSREIGPVNPAEQFALLVQASLEGPVLRYSQRQRLLREAARLEIPRFEANLIIALVQHRASSPAYAPAVISVASAARVTGAGRRFAPWGVAALIVLGELAILALALA